MGRIVRAAQPARPVSIGRGNIESTIGKADLQADEDGGGDQPPPADGEPAGGDGYLDRVAKYVPAEIVAFFVFVNSILDNAAEAPVAKALTEALAKKSDDIPGEVRGAIELVKMAGVSVWTISWIVLIVGLVMTPIYLTSVTDPADQAEAPGTNIIVSMIAFPFWAYAVNALAFRPWHDGALASIMLATFTVISGAIRPGVLSAIVKWIRGIGARK